MPPVEGNTNSATFLPGTSSTANDFIFKEGKFYATFDGHLYPRKSAPELYEHLTYVPPPPIVNENGKRTWTDSVDSYTNYPAHFYGAQLLHYGLKPLKTKAAAKKRLMEAFSGPDGRSLEVPRSILDFEHTLRAQGQSNLVVVDAAQNYTGVQMDSGKSVEKPKMPRTKQTARKTTKPTAAHSTAAAQTSRMDPPKLMSEPVTIYQPASSSKTAPRTKQTAVKTSNPDVASRFMPFNAPPKEPYMIAQTSTSSEGRAHRTKQTARKSTGRKPPKATTSKVSKPSEPRAAVKRFENSQADDPVYDVHSYVARDNIRDLTPVRARQLLEILFDRLPAAQAILEKELVSSEIPNLMAKEKPAAPSEWAGMYDMEAPSIDEGGERELYSFEIYPSSTSKHLWASFDFGRFTGVMRSIHSVPKFFNTEILFEWRGHIIDDAMSFGDENRAMITLHPGGLLKGQMFAAVHGTYHIYGCRPARPGKALTRKLQLEKVKSWKSTWRRINTHNYEVANRARWGKYGGEEREEEAFLSDTTIGKGKRTTKINLENFMPEAYPSDEDECDDDGEHGW